jgi:tetratricopeptide (TPR) repeat protein
MTPEERHSLETQAERHLRRGELSEAFEQFQQVARAFPADTALQARIAQLKENLQPAELMNPRSNFHSEPAGGGQTPVDQAEALASRGDYAGAIGLYRKLLAERPESELIRERLAELFRLVQAQKPRRASPQARENLLAELLGRISSRKRQA